MREMKNEANLIADIYYKLCGERCLDVARVINYCCIWESKNAISKVKYWLKYGLDNDGDYTENESINEGFPDQGHKRVSIGHLKYAFELIVEAIKAGNFYRNE